MLAGAFVGGGAVLGLVSANGETLATAANSSAVAAVEIQLALKTNAPSHGKMIWFGLI
jgi:hypothetical protein